MNVMTAAVLKAARPLPRDFGEVERLQVSRKGTANFVTVADRRTEKTLREELQKARPAFGFLMEEGGEIVGKDPEHRWVIDPIDGTTNFIHAIPYFCISVALEKIIAPGKSEILAAVIYDPIHNEMFTAEKGQGAYVNDKKLAVSRRDDFSEALFGTGSPRFGSPNYDLSNRMLHTVREKAAGIRFCGAAALDLAYVAAGRFDGYWHTGLQRWDMAAGMLLIQEAGGVVSSIHADENPLDSGTVCAANRLLHPALLNMLRVPKAAA